MRRIRRRQRTSQRARIRVRILQARIRRHLPACCIFCLIRYSRMVLGDHGSSSEFCALKSGRRRSITSKQILLGRKQWIRSRLKLEDMRSLSQNIPVAIAEPCKRRQSGSDLRRMRRAHILDDKSGTFWHDRKIPIHFILLRDKPIHLATVLRRIVDSQVDARFETASCDGGGAFVTRRVVVDFPDVEKSAAGQQCR